MSGWIWMKGVEKAVADPINPVAPEDEREAVKALIAQHKDKIEKVREGLKEDPLYDATKHDDLWILRFVISHKKTKPCLKAAKLTLQFRQKYNLDEEDIRNKAPHKVTSGNVYEYWQKRCNGDAIVTTHPSAKRGIIMFLQFGHFNTNAATELTEDVWDEAFVYTSEFVHQWLDYVTRTTGLLTKSVRFIDMRGTTMKHFDRKSSQMDAKIMNEMEDCYPQLLETLFACYAPSFMRWIWTVIRPIMPKRIIDKIDIVTPHTNEKDLRRLLKHISMDDLPTDYGGKNTKPILEW